MCPRSTRRLGRFHHRSLQVGRHQTVLYLGFAGMVSLAAEWWAWEIVGLVTSQLGVVALAAQSVLLVSSSVTYQLPFGASVATAVRVGNLLGANRPDEAKISSRVSLILSLAWAA